MEDVLKKKQNILEQKQNKTDDKCCNNNNSKLDNEITAEQSFSSAGGKDKPNNRCSLQ